MTRAYIGDKINCSGITVTIAEILYQDTYADEGELDIEFKDTHGNYRHWKQYFDGGKLIPATDKKVDRIREHITGKLVTLCNGIECTVYVLNEAAGHNYLVTCREPYISRFFNNYDALAKYVNGIVNGRFESLESKYNKTTEERYV